MATPTKEQSFSSLKEDLPNLSQEARLYEPCPDGKVRCHLCEHRCVIPDGKFGVCRVRQNVGRKLYTMAYGRAVARHVDPIEKKPLYHFYPGSTAYSIATEGCNFRCRWCQNWEISQIPRKGDPIRGGVAPPHQIVRAARDYGSRSIAYTYTEPTVFFEYALDTAPLAHAEGMANVFVTNGYMSEEMLSQFRPYLDAANVDLKAFRDSTYKRYVGARLQPVLDSIKAMKRLGIWLEVTTLVIPGLNDSPGELHDAAAFVARELGPDTPWHISRFYPAWQMADRPPTPLATLRRARDIGREEGLRYVYVGNVPEEGGQDTICRGCDRVLIRRHGFGGIINHLQEDHCPDCGTPVAGVGMTETARRSKRTDLEDKIRRNG
jgi:pyruvate formate lyase activating enzyme